MKKDKTSEQNEQVVDAQPKQSFFFPKENRSILATSLSEAQALLEAEKAQA